MHRIGLVGCGKGHTNAQEDNKHYIQHVSKKRVVINKSNYDILQLRSGNCYAEYSTGYHKTLAQVDCFDFGMTNVEKEDTNKSNMNEEILEYIWNNCVIDDGGGLVKESSWVTRLSGKNLSCKMPINIDKDINERKLYESLKSKYEDK